MNKTKLNRLLNDTTNLRKLILENPDLPLIIFCGEDAWSGEYGYEQASAIQVRIENLTLYNGTWIEKSEYEEKLLDDLCYLPRYEDLSDENYIKMIDKKVEATEFVKAIVIYVG